MGHICKERLQKIKRENTVEGFSIGNNTMAKICEPCISGQRTRSSFSSKDSRFYDINTDKLFIKKTAVFSELKSPTCQKKKRVWIMTQSNSMRKQNITRKNEVLRRSERSRRPPEYFGDRVNISEHETISVENAVNDPN